MHRWLNVRPDNAVTVLDTHDGIGVLDVGKDQTDPDTPGLVDDPAIDAMVERIHANTTGQSRTATGTAASNVDLYQVNTTYYDALAQDDDAYLLARAVQLFTPGVPADLLRRAARRDQRHGPAGSHRGGPRHQSSTPT